ncbi:MAG: acyl-CoA dehydrogenase family protein, partial [Pseudomonadota bacterium]|nr:acyl-CoA dehydrogenase family protein [Pseudomonadota bacterium]
MTFVLTEDQEMLRDTAINFTRDELPVKHLRTLRDNGKNGVDPDTRSQLAELGFFGVLIPEEYDGVGMGMVALGQVMEAQGRTLASTSLLQTACIGASAILLGGTEAQKKEWLPKIASGELTTALALDEGTHHNPTGV